MILILICILLLIFLLLYKKRKRTNFPLVVHQLVKAKPLDARLYRLLGLNQQRNPGLDFVLYDNDKIAEIIKHNFTADVYRAFCKINPIYGACVADFARYCILYLYGGIYLDIKSEIKKNIKPLLDALENKKTMMVCYGPLVKNPRRMSDKFITRHKSIFQNDYEFLNWVFICKPKNQIIYDLIQEISENILRGVNGMGKSFVLHLTGPRMFTSILLKHDLKNVQICPEFYEYFEYESKTCDGSCRDIYYENQIDYGHLKNINVLK